jgi:formylglycine-generating enzyme
MRNGKLLAIVAVAFAAAIIPACGSVESETAKDPGTEGGPCFADKTCMPGLSCRSRLCVDLSSGGTGGDASVEGWSGSTGAAGKGGAGGTAGLGGSGGAAAGGGTAGLDGGGGAAAAGAAAGMGGSAGGAAGSSGTAGLGGSAGQDGGTAGTAGTATGGSAGNCSPLCGALEQCWNGQYCVAKLVAVPGGYSIDATEVTRSQYNEWLATTPPTDGQPSYCTWNTSYTPGCEWPPYAQGQYPVVCVDWCDAHAYCAAVGKRLCGKIAGGPNDYGDFLNVNMDEWFKVCTSGGVSEYPYGGTYDGQACNGRDKTDTGCGDGGTCTKVAVATLAGCQASVSGYVGVYDLSGNAAEWEDSCNGSTDSGDACRARGGSVDDGAIDLRCDFGDYGFPRAASWSAIGFRCCSL